MNSSKKRELMLKAMDLRITGLKMVQKAHSGHIGGAFSMSELMAVLYFDKMNIRPEDPRWEDRDRFVLSKGHCTVALYPTLALRGFFDVSLLDTFRKIDGHLSGHAEMKYVPGVDMSTGSLGQGISCAVGMAMGLKHQGKSARVYTLLGDGEIQEGQVWEACMAASHYKLDNLVVIVDNNGLQIDGDVAKVMSPYPIADKLEAFGFHTIAIDGHDFDQMEQAFAEAKTVKGKPTAIVMKTVKGKGVSVMENNAGWHGKAPNDAEYAQAMDEIQAVLAGLEG